MREQSVCDGALAEMYIIRIVLILIRLEKRIASLGRIPGSDISRDENRRAQIAPSEIGREGGRVARERFAPEIGAARARNLGKGRKEGPSKGKPGGQPLPLTNQELGPGGWRPGLP